MFSPSALIMVVAKCMCSIWKTMVIVYLKSGMPTYLGTYILGHSSLRHYSCFLISDT